ncbi:MAG: DUF1566 domain-containing protein [bacterium]|nr:DUF1566 domain-containing protein [bacterium]
MERIFDITSNISTPLALAGLFATIFFFLAKIIIAKDIFPKFTEKFSSEILKLIINYMFVLSLVAMILGFLGYILVKKPVLAGEVLEIIGHVRLEKNGKPVGTVSGAEIALSKYSGYIAKTNEQGNFRLVIPEPPQLQSIELQVSYKGIILFKEVNHSNIKNVIIKIEKELIPEISGNIRLIKGRKIIGPAQGARIAVSKFQKLKTETDIDGNFFFHLPEMDLQEIELQITYKAFKTIYRKVKKSDFGNVIIEIEIQNYVPPKISSKIFGNVYFIEDRKPVAPLKGAKIAVLTIPELKTETDIHGNFAIELPIRDIKEVELQITYNSESYHYKAKKSDFKNLLIKIPKWSYYIDNGDNTITDKKHKLMWKSKAEYNMTWYEAYNYSQKKLNKYSDWRLPNKNELLNLAIFVKNNSSLFTGTGGWFWSSETFSSLGAYIVKGNEPKNSLQDKEKKESVRLIRSIK